MLYRICGTARADKESVDALLKGSTYIVQAKSLTSVGQATAVTSVVQATQVEGVASPRLQEPMVPRAVQVTGTSCTGRQGITQIACGVDFWKL